MPQQCSYKNARTGERLSCRHLVLRIAAAVLALGPVVASAAEQFTYPGAKSKSEFDVPAPATSSESAFSTLPAPQEWSFVPEVPQPLAATREFRPHGISNRSLEPAAGEDDPLLDQTTVWQRLKDYRSRNRVRVLTLWESGASTVSLQAGRKGEPSLQWTSRSMNRGGATRGLLDQLFSASIAGAGRSVHMLAHPNVSNDSTAKTAVKPLDGAPLK